MALPTATPSDTPRALSTDIFAQAKTCSASQDNPDADSQANSVSQASGRWNFRNTWEIKDGGRHEASPPYWAPGDS